MRFQPKAPTPPHHPDWETLVTLRTGFTERHVQDRHGYALVQMPRAPVSHDSAQTRSSKGSYTKCVAGTAFSETLVLGRLVQHTALVRDGLPELPIELG